MCVIIFIYQIYRLHIDKTNPNYFQIPEWILWVCMLVFNLRSLSLEDGEVNSRITTAFTLLRLYFELFEEFDISTQTAT